MKKTNVLCCLNLLAVTLMLICIPGCAPMSTIQKATAKGSMDKVDRVLADGANINDFSPVHGTPLRIAAEQGDQMMVLHLLEKGADSNLGSPLTGAALQGHADIIKILLLAEADVNNGGWNADSPLWAASEHNRPKIVAMLLNAHANPDGDNSGDPLWISSYRGYNDIVRQLLTAGANPNLQDCLNVAVRHSPTDTATRLLLEAGAVVDLPDRWGMTSLHSAAIRGRTARVKLLLEYGADRKIKDNSGKTAESYALEQDYPAIVKLLNPYY